MRHVIDLSPAKSLGLLAAIMALEDLGWSRYQAARWLRRIESGGVEPPGQASVLEPGFEVYIDFCFEIGFKELLPITARVHLVRLSRSAGSWTIQEAAAFNPQIPQEGACTWRFEERGGEPKIVGYDKREALRIFGTHLRIR